MAKARKVSRKELKQPDEFLSVGRQVLKWAEQHRTPVVAGAAGLLVVLAGIAAFNAWRSARIVRANSDLGRAVAALAEGEATDAARLLRETSERWPGLLPGKLAAVAAAAAELRAGNAESAALLFERVVREDGDLPEYARQEALYGWGMALLEAGRSEDALARLKEAAAVSGPYTPYAMLAQARALEKLGREEEARQLYADVLARFPDLPQRQLVESRLPA